MSFSPGTKENTLLNNESGSQHIYRELRVCVVASGKEVVMVIKLRDILIFASRNTRAAGPLDLAVCQERVFNFRSNDMPASRTPCKDIRSLPHNLFSLHPLWKHLDLHGAANFMVEMCATEINSHMDMSLLGATRRTSTKGCKHNAHSHDAHRLSEGSVSCKRMSFPSRSRLWPTTWLTNLESR